MKIGIALDGDGHFVAAELADRSGIIKILEACNQGGDHVVYTIHDLNPYEKELWENYKILSIEAWEKILRNFEQRGTFEIINL